MKILHINNYDKGGGAETVFHLTRKNLARVENYSGYIKREDDKEWPDINFSNWENNNKIIGAINFVFSFKNYRLLSNFLRNNVVDIIHIHAFLSPISPSILLSIKKIKRKKNIKVIETLHGFHMICPNMSLFNYKKNILCEKCIAKKYKLTIFKDDCDGRGYFFSLLKGVKSIIENNIIGHRNVVDHFIAPSEFLRQKFIEDGIEPNRISLVRNPIVFNYNTVRAKKENIVCYFGRFSREKNLEFLIDAFTQWKQKTQNDFKLLLIGEGKEEKRLLELIKKSIHKESITLKKFMPKEELIDNIKFVKYFSMSSKWYENAPMTILEVLSMQIIPLVPSLGGMEESINKVLGVGKTYIPGDIDSWIDSIEYLENNYEHEFEKLVSAQLELQNKFSLSHYIKDITDLYNNLAT